MNLGQVIIITDTNIIFDLHVAGILRKFIELDNVYMSDLVLHDEISVETFEDNIRSLIKTIAFDVDMLEINSIQRTHTALSIYDILNFLLARKEDGILATRDKALIKFSNANNVSTIDTLEIIKMMYNSNTITKTEVELALNKLVSSNKTNLPVEDKEKFLRDL